MIWFVCEFGWQLQLLRGVARAKSATKRALNKAQQQLAACRWVVSARVAPAVASRRRRADQCARGNGSAIQLGAGLHVSSVSSLIPARLQLLRSPHEATQIKQSIKRETRKSSKLSANCNSCTLKVAILRFCALLCFCCRALFVANLCLFGFMIVLARTSNV